MISLACQKQVTLEITGHPRLVSQAKAIILCTSFGRLAIESPILTAKPQRQSNQGRRIYLSILEDLYQCKHVKIINIKSGTDP